jgi:hypothetical protein
MIAKNFRPISILKYKSSAIMMFLVVVVLIFLVFSLGVFAGAVYFLLYLF